VANVDAIDLDVSEGERGVKLTLFAFITGNSSLELFFYYWKQ